MSLCLFEQQFDRFNISTRVSDVYGLHVSNINVNSSKNRKKIDILVKMRLKSENLSAPIHFFANFLRSYLGFNKRPFSQIQRNLVTLSRGAYFYIYCIDFPSVLAIFLRAFGVIIRVVASGQNNKLASFFTTHQKTANMFAENK